METFKFILVLVSIFVGLPLLIVWANDKIFRRRPSKAKIEESSRRFKERLVNPDIAAVEAHFGCALPEALRKLYTDKVEILKGDFEVLAIRAGQSEQPWFIAFYMPADLQSVKDVWPQCKDFFAFADDGCGNGYLIDPRKPNSEVLYFDHEGGEFEGVGMSLTEFLSAPRRIPTG